MGGAAGVATGAAVSRVASPKFSGAPPVLLVMEIVLGNVRGATVAIPPPAAAAVMPAVLITEDVASAGTVLVVTVMLFAVLVMPLLLTVDVAAAAAPLAAGNMD